MIVAEKERAQEQAVREIEQTIKDAQALQDETICFFDRIRKGWDHIAYQSAVGCKAIKLISALVVFLSLFVSVRFGMAQPGSLVNDVLQLSSKINLAPSLVVLAAEFLISLFWLEAPLPGTAVCAVLLYMCYGGFSPIAMMLAFSLLFLFQFEDRPVSAMMIALPALTFLTTLHLGIFVVVVAGFASTRKHSGIIKSTGFVYLALLELCSGTFGVIRNQRGNQVIPISWSGIKPLVNVKNRYQQLISGTGADVVFSQVLILLAVFLVVGLVFAALLNLRYSRTAMPFLKKMQIDVKDGILCIILLVLLCLAPTAVTRYSTITEFGYSYGSIVIQLVAAYILTRPFAGVSPDRGEAALFDEKHYIFISYAHSDLYRIKPYLKILDQKGYEFWYDDNIRTGTEWQDVIASNLANCTCFLAFISKSSVVSEYCLKEINYATSKKKDVAVIMLDDVKMPPVLEMHLASLQAVQRGKFDSDENCMNKIFELEQLNRCKR